MLSVVNLRKEFETVVAVDGVSLEVHRGELFGLLGPNGAGKTTTIRTILNIIKPDSGEITFDGNPFTPETWNLIGYLPEERGLYRKSKIINTILYFASLKGIPAQEAKPRAMRWLGRFELEQRANDKVEELSKGNQQKVQLIASLLHDPQLLILDEPFAGLDPVNQVLLKDVLMEVRQQQTAIIFSTHQMEQVEKMCDNICLINKGRPVLNGPLRDVKRKYGKNSVHLEFDGDAQFLKSLPMVRKADVYQNYAEVELNDPAKAGELLKTFDGKLSLRKFEIVEPSLNSIFIDVVGAPENHDEEEKEQPKTEVGTKRPLDARAKRSLWSAILVITITVILAVVNVQKENPDWQIVALMGAVSLISLFGFFRQKKKSEAGETRPDGEGRQ